MVELNKKPTVEVVATKWEAYNPGKVGKPRRTGSSGSR